MDMTGGGASHTSVLRDAQRGYGLFSWVWIGERAVLKMKRTNYHTVAHGWRRRKWENGDCPDALLLYNQRAMSMSDPFLPESFEKHTTR